MKLKKYIFDNDTYEITCSTYDQTMNASLPDEEEFEVLKIEVSIIEKSKRWPYLSKKTKTNEIECNFKEDDLEKAFMRALDLL